MEGVTADNIAAHTRIQINLSANDADPEADDYKSMYERERVENEKLRTQLNNYQNVLEIEVKGNKRRHDNVWDLEEALKKKIRKMAKLEHTILAALTNDWLNSYALRSARVDTHCSAHVTDIHACIYSNQAA